MNTKRKEIYSYYYTSQAPSYNHNRNDLLLVDMENLILLTVHLIGQNFYQALKC